jgi:transposase
LKKHNNSRKKNEPTSKRTKSRGPVQRDTKEVLAEGQLRTTQEHLVTFFQELNAARVVAEVGTHSAWVQEVIRGCGHEVLVANPLLMDGSKRRKRKNDRIDANKLARLGRVDPESLYPIQHRSREVRQDLVMLRARDALVAARTEIINTTRGLVKSMGTRLPKCSSRSFAQKGEEAVAVEMREALLPLVRLAATLSADIKEYDKKTEELGREKPMLPPPMPLPQSAASPPAIDTAASL